MTKTKKKVDELHMELPCDEDIYAYRSSGDNVWHVALGHQGATFDIIAGKAELKAIRKFLKLMEENTPWLT